MTSVTLFCAQDIPHREPVEEVTIYITDPTPADATPDETRRFFAADAARLADALWASLPGGTLDALIGEMLTRRASLLRVPMPTPDGAP